MPMSRGRRWVLLAAAALAAGCSGASSDGGGSPDGAAELICDSGGGEAFDLAVGTLQDESTFVEIADGDDVTLVLGAQGLYMIHLETRALLSSVSDQEICMTCAVEVGPTDAGFPGMLQDGPIAFIAMGSDAFAGAFNVILGSPQSADSYADS